MDAKQHNDPKVNKLLGQLRFDKEKTQIACLLMVTGFPEIVQPLTWIAGLVNGGEDEFGNPTTVTTGLPFSTLFGYICCVAIGVLAVLVGYAEAFHNAGKNWLTLAVSIFVQTAYILTVSSCMNVTRVASNGLNYVVPPQSDSEPEPNAQLLGAMGVIAIIAYWFGMLGSISMLLGSLQKFQENKPEERDGNYYRGRLFFYSFVLFLGGMSQLIVGAHLEYIYDLKGGPLPNGAFVKVAMYLIRYPSLAITVGAVQVVNAIWGMLRQLGYLKAQDGGAFVCSIWFGWLVQLVLQNMVQPSILPSVAVTRAPPTLTAFGFGMNFMPAFLDSKANSLPAEISREYYGLDPLPSDSPTQSVELGNDNNQQRYNEHSGRYETVEEC